MFNFGDGAVAGLLVGDAGRNEVLGSHAITDGSYSLQVKVPGGGSVDPDGYRFLDVADPRVDEGRARRRCRCRTSSRRPRARSSAPG